MATTLHLNDRPGSYPDSYYHATAVGLAERTRLSTDTTADVCIIGGGFTGLSSALHLAGLGIDVVVLDAHRMGWGASGRNGGQAGSGQRVDQDTLEDMLGKDLAREAWRIGIEAPRLVQSLIAEHKIDAQWQTGIVEVNHKARFDAETEAYVKKLQDDYEYPYVEWLTPERMVEHVNGQGYFGGFRDTNSGHIHPLNYALGLAGAAEAKGARLFECTEVASVDEAEVCTVTTTTGRQVRAKTLLYACNGYLGHLKEQVGQRVLPINSFVVATEPLPDEVAADILPSNSAVYDSRFVVNYYRLSADKRLLFGGGETYGYKFASNIKEFVSKPLLDVFPQLKDVAIDYGWGGTLGITMNRMPAFQRLANNVFSISGYSGSGVSMATMAGKIFADTLAGNDRDFAIMEKVPTPRFPESRLPFGKHLRTPMLALAMKFYALRDQFL